MDAAYVGMDPNSEHQRWSRWIFGIEASVNKCPSVQEVVANARRYFALAFNSTVGRVRCDQQGNYYCVVVEIEGPPVHDPDYVEALKRDFIDKFMYSGFGFSAQLTKFVVGLLAGNKEDGTPSDQMLVMPSIPLISRLST